MRLSIVIQFLILIVIGCGVYRVANQYQLVERKVNTLDRQSEQENENIRVLQAEWAFLTNPVRMEKIARDYFQLTAVDGSQMVAINSVPLRETMDANDPQKNIADDKVETLPENITVAQTPAAPVAQPVAAALPPAMPLPTLAPIAISATQETR